MVLIGHMSMKTSLLDSISIGLNLAKETSWKLFHTCRTHGNWIQKWETQRKQFQTIPNNSKQENKTNEIHFHQKHVLALYFYLMANHLQLFFSWELETGFVEKTSKQIDKIDENQLKKWERQVEHFYRWVTLGSICQRSKLNEKRNFRRTNLHGETVVDRFSIKKVTADGICMQVAWASMRSIFNSLKEWRNQFPIFRWPSKNILVMEKARKIF